MPRWQRVYVIGCAAAVGYCLLYTACDFGAWPRLTYFQVERTWQFTAATRSPLPSNYLGTVLWGVIGGAAAAAAAWAACRMRKTPIDQRWVNLWGGWAMTAFGFGCAYYLWNLWP